MTVEVWLNEEWELVSEVLDIPAGVELLIVFPVGVCLFSCNSLDGEVEEQS